MSPATAMLPEDHAYATLIGRLLMPAGPSPVLLRNGMVLDVSTSAATVADLVEADVASIDGPAVCRIEELGSPAAPKMLAPIDLQCIKACGVTFAVSAIERVIEEKACGDAARAAHLRGSLEEAVGRGIRAVAPGSAAAEALKQALLAEGMWSQYLEVAIGPDAEVFTKGPVLSAVGWGDDVGIRSDSTWNNPEPEIVLVVDAGGTPRGAALGNDVNLRDFEGRSALLLGKAKDNNASTAIGPFVRLFDDRFGLEDVRTAEVELVVEGVDGFRMRGISRMDEISRDPTELVRQTLSEHQYPDGFVLFLGTLFAPVQDRGEPGAGFTHVHGDRVRISSPRLGMIENRVVASRDAPPWEFGIRDLMRNLALRGLL